MVKLPFMIKTITSDQFFLKTPLWQPGNNWRVTSAKLAEIKLPSGKTPTGVSASAESAKLTLSPPMIKME
jgi:hypothetical protein